MSKLKRSDLSWDWKSCPSFEELSKALEVFGLHVVEHPACDGTDQYGYIITNRPLTKDELDEAAEEC